MAVSLPFPPVTPILPDTFPMVEQAISDPEKWNTAWESLYVNSPNLVHPRHVMGMAAMFRERHQVLNKHNDQHGQLINYEGTCHLQHYLGAKTIDAFIHSDFEKRWLEASISERRRHALRSLAHAGSQAWNLNLARAYCPDILKLDHLTSDGQVLLELLKEVTPQDISVVPTEPHWFANAGWDELREIAEKNPLVPEVGKLDMMEIMVLRTKLIFLVLGGITMASFLGQPLPGVTVNKVRDRRPTKTKKREIRTLERQFAADYNDEGKSLLKEVLDGVVDRKRRAGILCENCHRPQRDDEKFMRCKRCFDTIVRNILYCGKDCQVADWKARHKQICGKLLSSLDAILETTRPRPLSEIAPPTASQFPSPTNGFKRPPQLVMHIRLHDMEPGYDYMLQALADKSPPIKFTFHNETISQIFRDARYKAFVTGDRKAYAEMCHFLIWFLRAGMYDYANKWDLNYTVDVMQKELAWDGLRDAMRECQERQWSDESRRPPLVSSLAKEEWQSCITQMAQNSPHFTVQTSDEKVQLAVFLPNRRMESKVAAINGPYLLFIPTQAIWEEEQDQLTKDIKDGLKFLRGRPLDV